MQRGSISSRTQLIVAAPPTPNGDLHIGHLAGPYLGADVATRYMRLRGERVVSSFSVDTNQTHVVVTAEKERRDPNEFAIENAGKIEKTLSLGGISFDFHGRPDAEYSAFIQNYFRDIFEGELFKTCEREFWYDIKRDRFLFESYIHGVCPVCLTTTTGNICATCGHPNDPGDFVEPILVGGETGDELARRRATIVVLEMDRFAGRIRDHVSTMRCLRPRLRRLLDELLAGPLPEIPVTYPSMWGVPASFAGLQGSVVNAWLELNPGHLYWLRKAWSRDHAEDMFELLPERFEYSQFFGFDNSLLYAVAHIALALAAQDVGLPTLLPKALITNEFYELDGTKFSTSKGHVLWGRDVLHHVTVDEFRFFMCWSNPETQSSNFTLTHLCVATERNLRAPLAVILDALERWWSPKASAPPTPSPIVKSRCDALRNRFENSYGLDNPSLRQAGQALVLGLAQAAVLAVKCNDAPTPQNIDDLAFLFRHLAICAVPMMPTTSLEWLRRLGMDCNGVAWNMPTERLEA